MPNLRRLLDNTVLAALNVRVCDRAASYLSWQRRRRTRRIVESRLRDAGAYPNEVQAGPFRGMKLPSSEFFVDARFEKTFGAYEFELFDVITSLAADPGRFDRIVNLGAADGFYTVGLGMLFPRAIIEAYEPNTNKTPVMRELATLNQVAPRIRHHGACSPDDLRALDPEGSVLVVCDVDGYEKPLLDPAAIPWLNRAALLVETHDCFVPGITQLLKDRFKASHDVKEIAMHGFDYASLPLLASMTMHEVDSLVGSERPNLQSWLVLTPSSSL